MVANLGESCATDDEYKSRNSGFVYQDSEGSLRNAKKNGEFCTVLALVHRQSHRGVAESCHIQGEKGLGQDEEDEEENSQRRGS